jgi:hypothetical protein
MDIFPIPDAAVTPQTPFVDMHAWQWAKTQARADVDVFKYLKHLGFIVGTHRISEEQFTALRYCFDTFHRTAPHISTPLQFTECFAPCSGPGGYYVKDKPGRWTPKPVIVSTLIGAGWIYDVGPSTTYFEIIKGRLFAKYQGIIGSRCLVELSE